MWIRLAAIAVAFVAGFSGAATSMPAAAQTSQLLEPLYRIELLPRFRESAAIGMFSSYDRTGGNDDGFNGTHSFIRKEPGGLVIAEMKGPGVITRIWTPTPTDDTVEFYFDGEALPRIREKFNDLFSGKRFPFLAPVSGFGAGGFYTYAPIPYARSMKVVVKAARVNFYQLNYATYPASAGIASWSAGDAAPYRTAVEKAAALWPRAGGDASRAAIQRRRFNGRLAAGRRATIFENDSPGRIAELKIGPASALAGEARDIILNVYYDGQTTPSISVPAGDFFGYAWGEPSMRSLLLGTADGVNYAYLPMPFDRSVKVELVSERRTGSIDIEAEVGFTNEQRQPDEGRLYALWRRENPTTAGKPFTFINLKGRGHLVGAILQAQGDTPGAVPEFFEGDDVTTIDSKVRIRGTGSEDFFNGGWYDVPGRWDDRVSLPLSGSLAFKRHLARTGGYRFFLSDAYPFDKSILQTIEHGPSGNKLPTDYAAVTFFYAKDRPSGVGKLPPLTQRRVRNPREVVFTPGWTTPVQAFSWSNATLAKMDDKIGGEDLRHLQFRATGREVFGAHYVMFGCEIPEAGRYSVLVQGIAGPAQGKVQLYKSEAPVGEAVDLYAPLRVKSGELPLGELELAKGVNPVMFKIVGKDDRSSGLGFDIYRIIFRKVG